MDIVIAIIAFLIALGLLVTFHEYGHFYVARKLGVKVLRFSVGFGKPLIRRKGKDGVDYVLAAIPLGGYVKMLDEREGPVTQEDMAHAFNRQALWKRTLIVLAGPVFNFIFAIAAYWLMFMIGVIGMAPIIGDVIPGSLANDAGLKPMTEFVEVGNRKTQNWQQVVNSLLPHIGNGEVRVVMKSVDSELTNEYTLNLNKWALDTQEPDVLGSLGIEAFRPNLTPIIGEVIAGEAAANAGLEAKDKIIAVNDQSVEYWQDFVRAIHPYPNQKVTLTVERAGETLDYEVTLGENEVNGKTLGYLGVIVSSENLPKNIMRKEHYGAWESFTRACDRTWHYITLTFKLIGKMITGKIGLQTISGPITIAQGAGATASVGIQYYLGFLALISVSLGVVNLLPIPVLDGGHLMFYAIEAVLRRPPSERFMQISYQIGIFCLIMLMTVAFYNDILRLY